MRLTLVVFKLELPRRAVSGEVDAQRRLSRDRVDQVGDRPQFGRHNLASLGQRPGDPVAFFLVA
jgi:hypothetical protein